MPTKRIKYVKTAVLLVCLNYYWSTYLVVLFNSVEFGRLHINYYLAKRRDAKSNVISMLNLALFYSSYILLRLFMYCKGFVPDGIADDRGTINETTLNDKSNSEFWSSFSSSEEALLNCAGLILNLPLTPHMKCSNTSTPQDIEEAYLANTVTYKSENSFASLCLVAGGEATTSGAFVAENIKYAPARQNVKTNIKLKDISCTCVTQSCRGHSFPSYCCRCFCLESHHSKKVLIYRYKFMWDVQSSRSVFRKLVSTLMVVAACVIFAIVHR